MTRYLSAANLNACQHSLQWQSDSSPIHNLANSKKQYSNQYQHCSATATDNETAALLETRNQINILSQQLTQQQSTQQQQQPSQQQQRKSISLQQKRSKTAAPRSLSFKNSQHSLVANGFGGGNVSVGGAVIKSGNSNVAGIGEGNSVSTVNSYESEGPHAGSLGLAGGPLPPRRRFGNFFKSMLETFRPSHERNAVVNTNSNVAAVEQATTTPARAQLPPSPEIRITRTPSEQNVLLEQEQHRHQLSLKNEEKLATLGVQQGSTSSLNVIQQKLWHMLKREGSVSSLNQEMSQSIVHYTGLRKCETVLALTRQTSNTLCSPTSVCSPSVQKTPSRISMGSGVYSASGVEQIRPLNRLRHSVNSINNAGTCSRCSSLLSLAATGSRYSLNGGAAFVNSAATSVSQQYLQGTPPLLTVHKRHASNVSGVNLCATRSNYNSYSRMRDEDELVDKSGSSFFIGGGNLMIPRSESSAAVMHSIAPSNGSLSSPPNTSSFIATSAITPTTPTSTYLPASAPTVDNAIAVSPTTSATTVLVAADTITTNQVEQLQQQQIQNATNAATVTSSECPFQMFTCKLCLIDVESSGEATTLLQCGCQFCTECMKAYVEFEISEGAYEISCPDAQCPAQGIITIPEIAILTTTNLMKKHHRYRLNREIELDKSRTWCPRAGCETVCLVGPSTTTTAAAQPSTSAASSAADGITPLLCAVQCPSCKDEFCSTCKKTWHPNISCEEHSRRLVADGQDDIGIPFDNELIKCCPMCAVPIEKDEGCAQMMCKRCKHVFCWYCLASLDDDFLLRHYDKGPCKNKLGHSRASVVWHRAQVIGIFAGFGILLLVASPLLLLAAPCIICCKCRSCSGSKIDESDGDLDEATTLQTL